MVQNPNYGGFKGGLIPYSFVDTTAANTALTYLKNYNVPYEFDLLVVDVEGKEDEVFYSFNFKEWKPKMIIVELVDDHQYFQKNQFIHMRNLTKFQEDSCSVKKINHSGRVRLLTD